MQRLRDERWRPIGEVVGRRRVLVTFAARSAVAGGEVVAGAEVVEA
ncbi:hypothetical protein [Amycolatopsis sp. DSM 110486]|nr:hypothetical protein [Amycolatopsis sp. DSM 110486]QYN16639.1 hypothetical protein K1T34_27590 [Amycolatopsis sp. DSM 110486]